MKLKANTIKLLKKLLDLVIERAVIIAISLITAGGIGECNHIQQQNSDKWIGEHLKDKQQQIDLLKGSE